MTQLQQRTALTTRILLGAIAASLCLSTAWALYTLFSSHEGNREPVEVPIPDVSSVRFDGGANYPAMLERPLFWPERAPAPPGETGAAGSAQAAQGPEGLLYLGGVVRGDVRQALLQDSGSVHVLREGERIRGLEVRHISAEGVTLVGADSEAKLPAPVDRTEFIEIRRME